MDNLLNKIIDFIRTQRVAAFFLIVLLVCFSYGNILDNEFVLADNDFLIDYPLIQDLANTYRFFVHYISPEAYEGLYTPVRTLLSSLLYQTSTTYPSGYHVFSLLVHFLGILFVYRISLLLFKDQMISFISALLFALHPALVESVTYITASIGTFGSVLGFMSFYYYARTTHLEETQNEGTQPKKIQLYILSLVLAFIGIMVNENIWMLPLVILFYELCFQKENTPLQSILKKISPYFLIVLFYFFLKHKVTGSYVSGEYINGSFTSTVLVSIKALVKYMWLSCYPAVLTINHVISKGIYSYNMEDFDRFAIVTQDIFDPMIITGLSILSVLLFLGAYTFKKRNILAFGIGWFLLGLIPALNILPTNVLFAEQFIYFSLFGFCLLAAYGLSTLLDNSWKYSKLAFVGVLIIIVGLYGTRTYLRNNDWNHELPLYTSAVENNPFSASLVHDLAVVYMQKGYPKKAIETFKQAIAINAKDPSHHFALAEAYMQIQEYVKAEDSLITAVEIDSEYAEAYFNLATVYAIVKENEGAQKALKRALLTYRKQGKELEASQAEDVFLKYFDIKKE